MRPANSDLSNRTKTTSKTGKMRKKLIAKKLCQNYKALDLKNIPGSLPENSRR